MVPGYGGRPLVVVRCAPRHGSYLVWFRSAPPCGPSMSLKDVLLGKSYSSDVDSVLDDFLVPCLEHAVLYLRLAGFFSSTSLAAAARGIVGLIRNSGAMRVVASPRLTRKDLEVLKGDGGLHSEHFAKVLLSAISEPELVDEFVRDHVGALGWMLSKGTLDIRIAVLLADDGSVLTSEQASENGLFHPKVGVVQDGDGNVVTFSGSINETASAWERNVEEFKVFRSWEIDQTDYVEDDRAKFMRFWNGTSPAVRVMAVPDAVREGLIELAATDPVARLSKHVNRRAQGLRLFEHQERAVRSWLDHGMTGIFSMATGTGKTIAALACVSAAMQSQPRLATVVSCPYSHLVSQWRKEVSRSGIECSTVVADGTNPYWRVQLPDALADVVMGYTRSLLVLTTHRTLSCPDFVKLAAEYADRVPFFLIADEMHGLGALRNREGLTPSYRLRLGLSATPKRWFDEPGTTLLLDYLGGVVYELSLSEAITTVNPLTSLTYLVPFEYRPQFVSLEDDELDRYLEETRKLVSLMGDSELGRHGRNDVVMRVLFRRANIIKNARAKTAHLHELLDGLPRPIHHLLIYCSPAQIDDVMGAVNDHSLAGHRFTMAQGTSPLAQCDGLSERDLILKKFADGKYQVLVAMKCLDEGVDVPPAQTAILLASSGNPREHIQRIGRVVRQYPGKEVAYVYDYIVAPLLSGRTIDPYLRRAEARIFGRELDRFEDIARTARNSVEALSAVYDIKCKLLGVS